MSELLKKALASVREEIESGLAVWSGEHFYFNEHDKKELLAELDQLTGK